MVDRPFDRTVGSVLAIDAGWDRLKTALILSLEDGHHVAVQVSLPALSQPQEDSPFDLALEQLEDLTGWRIRPGQDESISQADAGVVTSSAPRALRVSVIAAQDKDRKLLLRRLDGRGGIEIVSSLCVTAPRGGNGGNGFDKIMSQKTLEAEVILVAAGSRRDAELVGSTLHIMRLAHAFAPAIVFAGPPEAAQAVEGYLPGGSRLTQLSTAGWSERDVSDADLEATLLGHRIRPKPADLGLPAHVRLEEFVSVELGSARLADAGALLAQIVRGSVGIVDIGGANTTITVEPFDEPARKKRASSRRAHAALGTSRGLSGVLDRIPDDDIARWLPFTITNEELRDYLANRCLSGGISQDVHQLMIEQAVARACGIATRSFEMRSDFLIATGGLATYPRLAQSVLTLLDIAQPLTPCRVLIDRAGLLDRVTPLSAVNQEAALSVLKSDVFVNAGVCLSLQGKGKPGESIAEVGIQRLGSGSEDPRAEEVHTIRFGTITHIPLAADEQAGIRVTTARRNSFGIEVADRPWAAKTGELPSAETDTIAGGMLGLIIDARGRPIDLPLDSDNRQARLTEWLSEIEAYDSPVFSSLDS